MLTYNQRYRPRTTREYTKSDLTVYDSAGNTALNALTVYGKSEVVDGTIKSAGEGWATVDLGTLNWQYREGGQYFTVPIPDCIYAPTRTSGKKPMISGVLLSVTPQYLNDLQDKQICYALDGAGLYAKDFDYTDATDFKTAMSGVMLIYELTDPTQGNAIAVKTDNGTGIDGTMAVFTTGTPLRGIPDTDVRDVMTWDGSARTVTKNCGEVDLGTLTWRHDTEFYTNTISEIKAPELNAKTILCDKYNTVPTSPVTSQLVNKDIMLGRNQRIYIKDTDYTDVTAFKNSLNGVKLVYELATPTTEQLTQTENTSIANLRTFDGTTHFTNNASTDMTVNYTIKVPTI